eukprot:752096-Hanusia_phi.AAC.2
MNLALTHILSDVPDQLDRGIHHLSTSQSWVPKDVEDQRSGFMEYVESLKKLPIAMNTADANEQHYELPPGEKRETGGREERKRQ